MTTFDKIVQEESAKSMVTNNKMNSIKSGSRQKKGIGRVILPKIMFYNQSASSSKQLDLPSLENSDRLISMDRASVEFNSKFPQSANPLDLSTEEP